MALQAGLRRLHDFGPQIRRAISGNLEDEFGFFAEEEEDEEEADGGEPKPASGEAGAQPARKLNGQSTAVAAAKQMLPTSTDRDFLPLHRRNHSLFGNKWTQGKWAQAGGKKQSYPLPLLGLATVSSGPGQSPAIRLDTLCSPGQLRSNSPLDVSLR